MVGGVVTQALVVVVDSHGEDALGGVLAYDVLVEEGADVGRGGYGFVVDGRVGLAGALVLLEYLSGLAGAVFADVAVKTAEQHACLRRRAAAEGAVFFVRGCFF